MIDYKYLRGKLPGAIRGRISLLETSITSFLTYMSGCWWQVKLVEADRRHLMYCREHTGKLGFENFYLPFGAKLQIYSFKVYSIDCDRTTIRRQLRWQHDRQSCQERPCYAGLTYHLKTPWNFRQGGGTAD